MTIPVVYALYVMMPLESASFSLVAIVLPVLLVEQRLEKRQAFAPYAVGR